MSYWDLKKEIVKYYIKKCLNIFDLDIDVNRCYILEIDDYSIVEEFLDNNNISSQYNYSFVLGLFYKHELISLCIFEKNSHYYKIIKHCDKINYNIKNSLYKLIEYFKLNYDYDSLDVFYENNWLEFKKYKKISYLIQSNEVKQRHSLKYITWDSGTFNIKLK